MTASEKMVSAFGSRAGHYAQGLRGLAAVVAEPEQLLPAYIDAVRRRRSGESFYGMLLLDDPRDRTMTALAPAVLAKGSDDDHRRRILNNVTAAGVSVNGKSGPAIFELDMSAELRKAVREFLALCPAVLVRSAADYARLSALATYPRPFELVLVEPQLPPVERRTPTRPGIVIWAPERDVAGASLHAFALAEAHADVTLVSADGLVPPHSSVTALMAGDPRIAEALATASSVVTTDAADPGAAVAFARRGYGVAAPASAGAEQFVKNLHVYDPAQPRRIYVAAMKSLGDPAALRALPQTPPGAPAEPELPPALAAAPPVVTVVVPTFNRRDDLERCLTCIGAQTYPNVRAVVINDAGCAVDDIVARFPFARLLNLAENGGGIRACMEGIKLVPDGFVQFLADDDVLYPDHVTRLATALAVSGAAIAHSNVLIRYVEREGGDIVTTGFSGGVFNETATPSEALVSSTIAGNGLMWRRSVFDEIGGWREDCGLADQEIQLRAAQRFAFVYVDQMTAEWHVHGANFSRTADSGAEQRRIYDVLHPLRDRPLITEWRNQALENIATRPAGFIFQPTVQLARPPPS